MRGPDWRLRKQNHLTPWLDCAARGKDHQQFARLVTPVAVYLGCRRCPVDTRVRFDEGKGQQ